MMLVVMLILAEVGKVMMMDLAITTETAAGSAMILILTMTMMTVVLVMSIMTVQNQMTKLMALITLQ